MFELPNISTNIVANATPYIASIGAAVAVTAGFKIAIDAVAESMESIDNASKASRRLAIDAASFEALQHQANLAGVEMGTVEQAVNQMCDAMADAVAGNEEASTAFESLGLSAGNLVNLSTDQTLGAIGDALASIENPAERAKKATEIFGMRAGPQLMEMLLQGSKGIQDAKDELDGLGGSLNDIDAAKVELANDAFTRVDKALSRVADAVAIELSPYLQVAAEMLTDVAAKGGDFGDAVGTAVEYVAASIAAATDTLHLLDAGWQMMRGTAGVALAAVLAPMAKLIESVEWLIEKLGGPSSDFGKSLGQFQESVAAEANDAFKAAGESFEKFQAGANSTAVATFFANAEVRSEAAAKKIASNAEKMRTGVVSIGEGLSDGMKKDMEQADEMMASLQREIDTFGMNDLQMKLNDFMNLPGVTDQQIIEFEKMINQLQGKKARSQLDEFFAGVESDGDAWDAGKQIKADPKLAEFIQAGSADAARLQFSLSSRENDIPNKQLAVQQKIASGIQSLDRKFDFSEFRIG